MARRPAPNPTKSAAAQPGGSGGRVSVTLVIIVMVVLAVVALPLCILVVAGLLPTMVALILDRHRALYLTRTVGAMNIAGIVLPALNLWDTGLSLAGLGEVVANPFNLLAMYGAAGLGWLVYLGIPPVAALWLDMRADDVKRRLEARAKALVEEWGEDLIDRPRAGG
jgi:hypothetical protein